MTVIQTALATTLLVFLWHGAMIILVLWLVLFWLRRASPNARYVACGIALVALTLAPPMTFIALITQRDISASPADIFARVTALAAAVAPLSHNVFNWPSPTLERWVPFMWSLGVAVCSLRFLRTWSVTQSISRGGTTPDSTILDTVRRLEPIVGVTRPTRVVLTSRVDGPSVTGWLRPIMLCPPAALTGLTIPQLESIIVHELTHIQRNDYLVNVAQALVETLLFYHPAVWWVSARMRFERELCCDDTVVRVCGDRLSYSRALAALERIRLGPESQHGLALASTDGPLMFRIRRILGLPHSLNRPMKTVTLMAIALAVACGAPLVEAPRIVASAGTLNRAAPHGPAFQFDMQVAGTIVPGRGVPADSFWTSYAGVIGSSTVRFIVDSAGIMDMTTFTVTKETNPRFTEAIRQGFASNAIPTDDLADADAVFTGALGGADFPLSGKFTTRRIRR